MIKKIRVMPDYGCYPVWLYGEDGLVIDTLMPEELRSSAPQARFDNLQARYEALFVNTEKEFSYKGFGSSEAKERFLADWQSAYDELERALEGRYPITNEIGLSLPD